MYWIGGNSKKLTYEHTNIQLNVHAPEGKGTNVHVQQGVGLCGSPSPCMILYDDGLRLHLLRDFYLNT